MLVSCLQCFLSRKTHTWTTSCQLTARPSSPLLCPLSLVTCRPRSRPHPTSPNQRTERRSLRPRWPAAARPGSASESPSAAATPWTRTRTRRRRRTRRGCRGTWRTSRRTMKWRGSLGAGWIYRKASRRRWICWVRDVCLYFTEIKHLTHL